MSLTNLPTSKENMRMTAIRDISGHIQYLNVLHKDPSL